jgi:hypothetical protein
MALPYLTRKRYEVGSSARRRLYFSYLIALGVVFAGIVVVSAADIGGVLLSLPVEFRVLAGRQCLRRSSRGHSQRRPKADPLAPGRFDHSTRRPRRRRPGLFVVHYGLSGSGVNDGPAVRRDFESTRQTLRTG